LAISIGILNRIVGPDNPCFVIAEAGVNHNGRMELARSLVDAAARVGADAIKFQTFEAEKLVTTDALKAAYQQETTGDQESQYEMLRRLELSRDQFHELHDYCLARKILFLSTPFDEDAADFLDGLGVPAFKVASGDITNLPLITHIAGKGKPVLLSTGMSYLGEVEAAVRTILGTENRSLALLHCTSNYPTAPEDANLRAMHTLSTAFGVPVGYSDHTQGLEISLAAVALGACMIEKHLTLDRHLPGPDHQSSIEPVEFEAMVKGIRKIEMSLGNGRKEPTANELEIASVARRSLVAARDIPIGTILTEELIEIKRPGTGLSPGQKRFLVGRATREYIRGGEVIMLEKLS